MFEAMSGTLVPLVWMVAAALSVAVVLLLLTQLWRCRATRARHGFLRLNAELETRVDVRTRELTCANTELDHARREAEAASHAKGEFLANISHEIRTPLNAVIGLVGAVLDGDLEPVQRDHLDQALASAHHLLDLINDVLDLSKVEAGKLEIEAVPFSLGEALDRVSSVASVGASRKGIALRVEVANDVPEALVGDPLRLRQVLMNLVSNAVKFTDSGSVTIGVEASSSSARGSRLTFSVRDTGCGMSPEQVDRLFQKFAQGDASVTRRHGGTGLGLAISKELVELMGGTIEVLSKLGRGTEFRFSLELGTQSGSEAVVSQAVTAELVAKKLGGCRVLLAEDNQLNQRVAVLLLQRAGLRVEVAQNGAEAIAAVERRRFDAILMDIQMPEVDGFEAARRIRDIPHASGSPIIAMTANAREEDRNACLEAGMTDFVTKPVDRRRLYRALLDHVVRRACPQITTSTASSSGSEPPTTPWTSAPRDGIDVARGLENVGGDEVFYVDLAETFMRQYQDAAYEIERAESTGNRGSSRRIAHTIKGLAGTLGALGLYQAAETLELALGRNGDAYRRALGSFSEELGRVVTSIDDLVQTASLCSGDDREPVRELDGDPAPVLRRLCSALEQNELVDSDLLDAAGVLVARASGVQGRRALEESVNWFDYGEALATLRVAAARLEVSL